MQERFLKIVISAAAIMVCIFGMSVPTMAKTFKWSFQGDLQSLDPYSLNETFLIGFLGNVYEGLVRRGPDLEIQPALAESWQIMEPTRWRFELRRGVKFHNGNDFNADDVIASYKRVLSEGSDFKNFVATIEKIVKIDDFTIDIITKVPNPILTSELSVWYIMDKEWCEEHKATESTNIKSGKENYATRHENGTGAFIVTERQKDVKTVLKPFDQWWDTPRHNLTNIIFTPITSDPTRVAALLSGEIDMMFPVSVQDIKRVKSHEGTSVMVGPELRTIFLGLNQTDEELGSSNVKGKNPLKDQRVRQAFYQAINVDLIKKKIMRGLSEPSVLMISPQLFPEGKNIQRYPYDPSAAKKLLAEAGYPDGFELCMDSPNDRYVKDEQICQAVVSMLAKIGVTVKLKAQPKAQFFKKVLSYDTDFYLFGWTPMTFDSHNVLYDLICTRGDSGRGKFNLGGYSNPEIDALTDKIIGETNIPARSKMIKKAYDILHQNVGYIPLHQQSLAWGKKDSIDLVQRADNQLMLYYVNVK